MDWLQFIAAIVGHLAWPLVLISLAIILRNHIGSMADRLIELSFGGAKITLERKLEEGASIIKRAPRQEIYESIEPPSQKQKESDAPAVVDTPPKPTFPRRHRTRDSLQGKALWEASAVGQIISGYEQVESVLFDIGDTIGMDPAQASSVMHTLVNKGFVDKEIADLYGTMKDARNLVAHAQALPNEREALEYVRQAAYLRQVLLNLLYKIDRREIKL
jgi:hypothetical protein